MASTTSTPSDLTYGWEPLEQLLSDGIEPIWEKHWREYARDHGTVPLDVDVSAFLKADRKKARWFCVRRSGRIIGYGRFIFFHPERYSSTLYVENDLIYVVPGEKRRAWLWLGIWDRVIADTPKPFKINFRVRHHAERMGKILAKRYAAKLSDLTFSAVIA